jgi:hypothetical protein
MIALPPDWKKEALRTARRMTRPFLMEEIRQRLAKRNIHAPKPNSWGWMTTELLRLEVIERTGDSKVTKDPRNHSRTNLYVVKR